MNKIIILSLLAAALAIPPAAADTDTCATPSACASTRSTNGGPGGDDPCDDGNYADRSIQLRVEGEVGLWTWLWNTCGGGEQEDGSHYRHSGIGQGLVLWGPTAGSWSIGGQWRSADQDWPDGRSTRDCTVHYLVVDESCPAGQRPPMVVPHLP